MRTQPVRQRQRQRSRAPRSSPCSELAASAPQASLRRISGLSQDSARTGPGLGQDSLRTPGATGVWLDRNFGLAALRSVRQQGRRQPASSQRRSSLGTSAAGSPTVHPHDTPFLESVSLPRGGGVRGLTGLQAGYLAGRCAAAPLRRAPPIQTRHAAHPFLSPSPSPSTGQVLALLTARPLVPLVVSQASPQHAQHPSANHTPSPEWPSGRVAEWGRSRT